MLLLKHETVREYFSSLLGEFTPEIIFWTDLWNSKDLSSLHLSQNNMLKDATLSLCDLRNVDFQLLSF